MLARFVCVALSTKTDYDDYLIDVRIFDPLENMMVENPYKAPQVDAFDDYSTRPYVQPSLMTTLFSFEGRIPRRVYWGLTLLTSFIFYALFFGLGATQLETSSNINNDVGPVSIAFLIIFMVLFIPMTWITLALQIKRWHDRDKSGWWIFIGVIPLIGPIWSFLETGCARGTFGPNKYGPDPT